MLAPVLHVAWLLWNGALVRVHLPVSLSHSYMLLVTLAVAIPPHARVNYRCYPVWNEHRTNLRVVWNGAEYEQPWTFRTEIDEDYETCSADTCVQRLWCTDSGAVGRYTVDRSQSNWEKNVTLAYTWLRNTGLRGSRALAAHGQENNDSMRMLWTSE